MAGAFWFNCILYKGKKMFLFLVQLQYKYCLWKITILMHEAVLIIQCNLCIG